MSNYYGKMLESLEKVMSFKTVLQKAEPDAPFGLANKQCLDFVLSLGEELGFTSKNVDGYAGHIEWKGKSDEIFAVLGHLDVVPEGDGWDTDPYSLTEKDGFLCGRGVLDDKGPVLSCLYAMKELKDSGFVPNKTIRLIMGCNEENGSTCVKYYFTKEKMPSIGISPDGEFPCIHAEKAILWIEGKFNLELKDFKNLKGGDKTNMVASKATIEYYGDLSADFFEEKGFLVARDDFANCLIVTSIGKSAHGSTPAVGDNAIWKLVELVLLIENNEVLKVFYDKFCTDFEGKGSNITSFDKVSGGLTQNVGTISSVLNEVSFSLDIRFPETTNYDEIISTLSSIDDRISFNEIQRQESLFVDPNSFLITTLRAIHKKHTGTDPQSLIIGGGTYARLLDYGVAFGPVFIGDEPTIHMPNEKVKSSDFKKIYDIYKDAIEELSK